MQNLALNSNNDIYVELGSIARVNAPESIAQRIKTRLQLFAGEWFLDRNIGVDWLGEILTKSPQGSVVTSLLRRTILDTPSVTELVSFAIQPIAERTIQLKFEVNTAFGTQSGEISI